MNKRYYKNEAKYELSNFNWFLMFVIIFIMGVSTLFCCYVSSFVGYVFSYIFTIGVVNVSVTLHKTKKVNFGKMFNKDVFKKFWNRILLGLLKYTLILCGLCLFIVPGIILIYSYSLAEIIALENPDYSPKKCLFESRSTMNGCKMDLFKLDLSFIWWFILCCFVPFATIWVLPYFTQTRTIFLYERNKLRNYKSFFKHEARRDNPDYFDPDDYTIINQASGKKTNVDYNSYNVDEDSKN